jgi:ATP-dependent protease ClpP protease subunit
MIGADYSPGRFERMFRAIPEGAILRCVFIALLTMAVAVVGLDYLSMTKERAAAQRMSRTEPLRVARPTPGDQIRPYLPKAIPIGPDRGEPVLPGYDGPVDGEAMAAPMRFIAAGDGQMTAIGRIEPGTADVFRALVEAPGTRIDELVLHSPGGSVEDAIKMARLVREHGIDTRVPADGYCASACPLLFSGGTARSAGTSAWIGLHQVFAVDAPGVTQARDLDVSIADVQAIIAECQELLVDMGVKPEVWIKAMKTPPEALYVLTTDELKDYVLVTPEKFGPPMPPDMQQRLSVAAGHSTAG